MAKLKAARDRKSYAEARPEMVELAGQRVVPIQIGGRSHYGRWRLLLQNAAMSRQPAGHTKLRPSRRCLAN